MTREEQLLVACAEGVAANVERWVRFIRARAGDVVELQALEVPQPRGAPVSWYAHATNPTMIVRLLTEPAWIQQAPGLFQIINRIDPRVAARDEIGKWHRAKRGGTSDRDIAARAVLPIDLDVVRPAGTSTSDAEMALSVAAADAVLAQLIPLIGEDSIAYGHSGNGRWIALALDHLEETKELREVVREILAALAAQHNSREVHVDVACCDAKRLGPAWGTVKRKGVPSAERPHRTTGIIVPQTIRRLSLDDLRALLEVLGGNRATTSAPPPTTKLVAGTKSNSKSVFDLANTVPIHAVVGELGLLHDSGAIGCPRGCSGGTSVALLEEHNLHKCSHATCADVGPRGGGVRTPVDLWAEVRGVEPADAAKALCKWYGIKVPRERAPRLTKEQAAAKSAAERQSAGLDLEIDVARRFVDKHEPEIRFAKGLEWLVWSGNTWFVDERENVRELVKSVANTIREQAAVTEDEKLWALARSCGRARGISGVLDAARSDPRIRVSQSAFDADPWLLNARNGTIDLRSGQLLPHEQRHLCTKLAPVDYDPAARAPRFEQFLEQILPDADTRAFVQRQLGYAATALVRENVLPVWYGGGSNGKSTLAEIVQRLLGDYACTVSSDLFMAKRNDDSASRERELVRLWHTRCAFASESKENRALDEATVKTITGGDTLVGRWLYKDSFQFEPTHKLTLRTNHKPRVVGNDDGIWRRLLLVPFLVSIPEAARDTSLKEKLWTEASGILTWLVEGCLEWQREGLKPSRAILDASKEYRSDMDVIGRFFDERCITDVRARDTFRVSSAVLYKAFTAWADEQGERTVTANAFGRSLSDRGIRKAKSGGDVYYLDVGLRAPTGEHWSSDRPSHDQFVDGDDGGRWGRSDDSPRKSLNARAGETSPDHPPFVPIVPNPDEPLLDRGPSGDDW